MSLIKIADKTKNIEITKKKKNHIKSTQFYSNKFIFFKYCNTENFTNTKTKMKTKIKTKN